MTTDSQWRVGEVVAYDDGRHGNARIVKVAVKRVLKSFVELENGLRFGHGGDAYPADRSRFPTSFPRIHKLTPDWERRVAEDQARREADALRDVVRKADAAKLAKVLPQLRALVAALKEAEP